MLWTLPKGEAPQTCNECPAFVDSRKVDQNAEPRDTLDGTIWGSGVPVGFCRFTGVYINRPRWITDPAFRKRGAPGWVPRCRYYGCPFDTDPSFDPLTAPVFIYKAG
jgi:hypothetical protein